MKTSSAMFGALLLLAGSAADGTLRAIEEAYELSLSQVMLPGSETATLLVRPCTGCESEALRVTAETRYFIRPATTPVSLEAARKAASKATGHRQASIYVYYDPKTRTVRRLVLDPGQ